MNRNPIAPNALYNLQAERCYRSAGRLFIQGENYSEALSLLDEAIAASPFDVRSFVLKGDILYCLNRDAEALDCLQQALFLNPLCCEAWISKAGVLDSLGLPIQGLQCCNEALKHVAPGDSETLTCIVDQQLSLLIQLRRYRQAKSLLELAIDEFGDAATLYLRECYGPMLDQLGRQRHNSLQKAKRQSLRVLPACKLI